MWVDRGDERRSHRSDGDGSRNGKGGHLVVIVSKG